jgi:hypothetical protein
MLRHRPPRGLHVRKAARNLLAVFTLLCLALASLGPAKAEETTPATASPAPAIPAPAPESPPAPGLDTSTAAPEPAAPSLLGRWWFWTAVGVVAAATVAVAVLSSRAAAPPATDLGNQEFKP